MCGCGCVCTGYVDLGGCGWMMNILRQCGGRYLDVCMNPHICTGIINLTCELQIHT